MANKNIKKGSSKKYKTDIINTYAEEPEAAYSLSLPTLSFIHGNKREKSFIKRSLELMGLDATAPFDAVENVSDFIDCIREGVPKKALDHLLEITGISVADMSTIIRTSDRTLRRYSPKQKLDPEQSERVIELAKVYSRGEEVFGTMDVFKEWMSSTVMALGNKKPKEFLDTSLGIEMLMDELGRIEHGIFA